MLFAGIKMSINKIKNVYGPNNKCTKERSKIYRMLFEMSFFDVFTITEVQPVLLLRLCDEFDAAAIINEISYEGCVFAADLFCENHHFNGEYDSCILQSVDAKTQWYKLKEVAKVKNIIVHMLYPLERGIINKLHNDWQNKQNWYFDLFQETLNSNNIDIASLEH
jgi:hypothetical protein